MEEDRWDNHWKKAYALELQRDLEQEWKGYLCGLQHLGIQLTEEVDTLVWTLNEKNLRDNC